MTRRALASVLTLSLVLLAWTLPARAADRVALFYDLSAGGLDVAVGQVSLDVRHGTYDLRSTMETVGLAAAIADFTVDARSSGAVGADLEPREHRQDSVWNGETRRVDLRYAGGGQAPQADVVPPPQADGRVPVTVEQTQGTLDPLSAIFALMRGLDSQGEASATVFDGRRLYSLAAGDLAVQAVKTPGYNGAGWQASLRYERLGGQSKRSFFADSDKPAEAVMDLAPGAAFGLSDDLMVPVRVAVPLSGVGSLVVLLREVVPVDAPPGANGGQAAALPGGLQ